MQYKQNLHVLLPVSTYEELRELGHKLDRSRSELAREAICKLLLSHKKKDKMEVQDVT